MERLRTRWAALAVALLLLLSVAGVAGAAHVTLPTVAAPEAFDQVAKEHDEDEDTDEDEDEATPEEDADEDTDEDTTVETEGAQGEHGAIVSAVAQNKECVGGPNNNHGWAVSQVATGTYVQTAGECPPWQPIAETTTDDTSASDTTLDLNPAGKPKGKSGEHKKPKTHGRWAQP